MDFLRVFLELKNDRNNPLAWVNPNGGEVVRLLRWGNLTIWGNIL